MTTPRPPRTPRPIKAIHVYIWSRWWVLGWTAILLATVAAAIWLPWHWWVPLALLTFLAPEIYAVTHEPSTTPPLTSILRRYVPSYLAFPLLGFVVGLVATLFLTGDIPRSLFVALVAALAFWLIEHFTSTYHTGAR